MSRPPLSKDTRLCISLAGRPSNIGTRFHNYLYDVLGLDFIYKAFTTTDIAAAIGGVRPLVELFPLRSNTSARGGRFRGVFDLWSGIRP